MQAIYEQFLYTDFNDCAVFCNNSPVNKNHRHSENIFPDSDTLLNPTFYLGRSICLQTVRNVCEVKKILQGNN